MAKSRLQAAADLASLAAAAICANADDDAVWLSAARHFRDAFWAGSPSAPQLEAGDYINDPDAPTQPNGRIFQIGPLQIAVRHPYADDYTNSKSLPPAQLVCVVARRPIDLPLAAIFGIGRVPVRCRAVAYSRKGSGRLAIFAKRQSSLWSFKWTGSGGLIIGNVHANGTIKFTGSDHHCTGWMEYVGSTDITGSGHVVEGGFIESPVKEYPINITPEDLQPYDYVIDGDLELDSGDVLAPGVYYVKGDFDVSGSGVVAENVTIIAEGSIDVTGSDHTFTAARRDVLFYSLDDALYAIDVAGSGGHWIGLCFAPYGGVAYTGSDQAFLEGCLIGRKVLVTGSDFRIKGTGPGGEEIDVQLVR